MYVAAIFGLVGVVIGGLLNGGVTWLTGALGEKKAARVQARALFMLLVDGEIAFRQTADEGRVLLPRDLAARIQGLDLGALASHVDDDAWMKIAAAESLIEQASSGIPDGEFRPEDAAVFRRWADGVHEGVNALQPLALPSKKPLPPAELPKPQDE
jgi:hypothetical protein